MTTTARCELEDLTGALRGTVVGETGRGVGRHGDWAAGEGRGRKLAVEWTLWMAGMVIASAVVDLCQHQDVKKG